MDPTNRQLDMPGPSSVRVATQHAFTLVELMVVIIVVGLLAALAIPKMFAASTKARVAEACMVLAAFDKAQLAYVQEMGEVGSIVYLNLENPCQAGYSSNFDYTDAVTAGSDATLTATGKAGQMGIGGQSIWTEVGVNMSVSHGHDDAYEQFAPTWK